MNSDERNVETADVVVIGAGVAGLAAARELARAGRRPLVLEEGAHAGGRIETIETDYGHLENGGIFHTHHYPRFRALLTELGLADHVVSVPTGFHSRILTDTGWHHADYGSLLGPFLFTGISVSDKVALARAAARVLVSRPPKDRLGDLACMSKYDDRSTARAITQRSCTNFAAGPHEFLWGVQSQDLSFAMMALQLHVFTGELREVRGGTGQVTDAMAQDLDVRLRTTVTAVEDTDGPVRVSLADGTCVEAEAVVIATTADVAARLWGGAPKPVRQHLEGISYSRIDYAYLHTREQITLEHRGCALSMEVIPTSARGDRTIGGIYQANGWANEGGLLLVTAANGASAANIEDDELLDRLQDGAEELHPELRGQVLHRHLVRHPRYTPTFGAGSVGRLIAAREALAGARITLAGDHMSAPWVEGAVLSGQDAARGLIAPTVEQHRLDA